MSPFLTKLMVALETSKASVISLVLLPSMVANFLAGVPQAAIARLAQTIVTAFRPGSLVYNLVYFFQYNY